MIKKLKKRGKKRDKKHQKRVEKLESMSLRNSAEGEEYLALVREFAVSTHIIVVVDARNPIACRSPTFESILDSKLVFVLNKIDLAPRECVLGWLSVLSQVAPTFAVSAINDCTPVVKFVSDLPESAKILVTGFENVGRKTIAAALSSLNRNVQVSRRWSWAFATPDLVALGCISCSSVPSDCDVVMGARDFIGRCSIQSVMEVCRVTFYSDADRLLATFPGKKKRGQALAFFKALADGELKFYCVPPLKGGADISMSEEQQKALKFSTCYDSLDGSYLMIGYGIVNIIKPHLIKLLQRITSSSDKEK